MVKLYRLTGKAAYLDLAKYFLDQRGRGLKLVQYPSGNRFAIYNDPTQIQAHKPVLEQDEAVGHAVRLTYMASGLADIAALTGDRAYFDAVKKLWENVVGKKRYLTAASGRGTTGKGSAKTTSCPTSPATSRPARRSAWPSGTIGCSC